MTSIEWFYNELIEHKIIKKEKHFTFVKNFATTYELLFEQAKKMYDEEMATNCSQPVTNNHVFEISDEEIEKAIVYDYIDPYTEGFINGAKWYREQLKNR